MKRLPVRCRRWLTLSAALIALCAAELSASAQVAGGKLPTRWDKDVSPTSPLPEYPRPQMVRSQWQSLNGAWDYAVVDAAVTTPPMAYAGKILVPYPYEAALSGIGKPSIPDQRLWYRRTFAVPAEWKGQRILLHFGAVNWDSTVNVNGKQVAAHRGGYDAFDCDVTDALTPGDNELVVSAWNPVRPDELDSQVVGKQRLHPGSVLYTACTGIWQTVWLEPVPAVHIVNLQITPDIDAGTLQLTVKADGADAQATVTATYGAKVAATATGACGTPITLHIGNPHLWSPADPYLYGLHVSLASGDVVDSYFAMRKVSLGKDDQGHARILLNNQFLFEIGVLDQGYWPDGIYTAPTDDALKFDIETAKKFGFNLIRKHAKAESDRWYYWTDKLGMLVWQDMPQFFGKTNPKGGPHLQSDSAKEQWLTEWKRILTGRMNHPSIIVWTPFNEDWGVHDLATIAALTRQLDPTRLVDSNTGGTDIGVGDLHDVHIYPGPDCPQPEADRAVANGELGGITMRVSGHDWSQGNFGYGAVLHDGWHVAQRYQQILKEAYAERDTRSASAFVYTQIVDVEEETNGLLTYDREIVKPLADIITAANGGDFPPLPPAPINHDLVPTSEDTPQTWSYITSNPGDDWFKSEFDSSSWKTAPAPFGQGYAVNTAWTDTPGDIWLRRSVNLPAQIPAKLVVLAKHDEDVEVYVNGVLAVSAPGYTGDYASLPMSADARAALKPGDSNVVLPAEA
jgi:hypothetical protein